MRIFVVLILAAAFVGGWFIWSRDPLADVPTDAHGFIELPLPHGADANTVLILTPPHSPDDLRQVADTLQQALQDAGIPAVRDTRYHSDDPAVSARFNALAHRPGPIVFVRNKARANPPLADVIAEYRTPETPQAKASSQ
ncbi:hypothetical protein ACF3OJ_09045 [Cardiobacterium hominis]|uniref:hypothetical protein n=1 Tax=Cardiobacterium hominis TaxID=2718 RepID=UPI00370D7CDC